MSYRNSNLQRGRKVSC
uniref:Uncharacterized protein n=1 Tax=Anguilla anguilla TaxID=7936 RepID=A0A0E9VQC2_ANGAN